MDDSFSVYGLLVWNSLYLSPSLSTWDAEHIKHCFYLLVNSLTFCNPKMTRNSKEQFNNNENSISLQWFNISTTDLYRSWVAEPTGTEASNRWWEALRQFIPHLPPKLHLSVNQSPNPTICLIPGPIQPTVPNRIHIQSAVLPQWTRQTHTQTNRWLEGMFADYKPLSLCRERRHDLITASNVIFSYCMTGY